MRILTALLLLAAYGCAHKPPPIPLPPLPGKDVYGAAEVPNMAVVYKDPPRGDPGGTALQLAWQNTASPFATNYQTVVEHSLDLVQWRELGRLAFVASGFFSVTNSGAAGYYRVANTIDSWPGASNTFRVTLGWDRSADPVVVGYNVYHGSAPRSYTNSVDAGNETVCTISNLVRGVSYHFAATAYSALGLESDYSTEATYRAEASDPVLPPEPENLTIKAANQ